MKSLSLDDRLSEFLEQWFERLSEYREHCSLCSHAKVRGLDEDMPWAECELYPGTRLPLVKLLRPRYPLAFGAASKCEHYDPPEFSVVREGTQF